MPSRKVHSEVVDTHVLNKEQRLQLADALYPLQNLVFDGVDKKRFHDKVICPHAEETKIRILRDQNHNIVGYCAAHRFRKILSRGAVTIFRAEAGIAREFRGNSATILFGLSLAFRFILRHPFTPCYFFCTLIHPSSYHLLHKYFPIIYPNVSKKAPLDVEALAFEIADSFQEKLTDTKNRHIRCVGWITRDTEEEKKFWHNSPHEDVQYFLKKNPGYENGDGLVTLLPLGFTNFFRAAFRFLKRRV